MYKKEFFLQNIKYHLFAKEINKFKEVRKMKKKVFSKSMSWILSVVMLFGVFVIMNTANIEANASSKMTLSQLKQKFPSGKYWNHAGSSSNNPDGYTSTPCTHHGNCSKNGTDYSGWCGCNSFGSSIQCFGFANKLAYDAFGSLYTSWSKTSLSNLKAGDVIIAIKKINSKCRMP